MVENPDLSSKTVGRKNYTKVVLLVKATVIL